jgi:hypothetical protein
MTKIKSRNGQIGLLVLLATIVVMTIAVALASRTASEIAISTNEEQSTSAFESAETIIERILGNPTPPPVNMSGSIGSETYEVTTEYVTKLETNEKTAGETVEVNLRNYAQNTFKVEWQGNNEGSCNTDATAVVVAVFYENGPDEYVVKRYAYDPCLARATTGPNPNGFLHINSPSPNNISISNRRVTANVPSRESSPSLTRPVSARIKILYSNSDLIVEGGNGFPQQGLDITSRASSLDDQSRAIRVTEGHPMAPSIFDYAVYSAGTIENVGP